MSAADSTEAMWIKRNFMEPPWKRRRVPMVKQYIHGSIITSEAESAMNRPPQRKADPPRIGCPPGSLPRERSVPAAELLGRVAPEPFHGPVALGFVHGIQSGLHQVLFTVTA